MERESRTRLLSAVLIAAVFGSGLFLGFAMDRNVAATRDAQAAETNQEEAQRPRRPPMWEQVEPTDEQRVHIDSVLKAHRRRMNALDEEFRTAYNPRYDAILHDTREGIKDALTSEQAAEYQAILDEFDRRRAEERAKGNRN